MSIPLLRIVREQHNDSLATLSTARRQAPEKEGGHFLSRALG
jgi:hypothetical protein